MGLNKQSIIFFNRRHKVNNPFSSPQVTQRRFSTESSLIHQRRFNVDSTVCRMSIKASSLFRIASIELLLNEFRHTVVVRKF